MDQTKIDELNQTIGYLIALKEQSSRPVKWMFDTAIEALEEAVEREKALDGAANTEQEQKAKNTI